MTTTGFPGIPKLLPDLKEHVRKIAEMLNDRINRGKFNATIDITLTPGATSTTLVDERIGPGSFIGMMPQTVDARQELNDIYITGRTKGSCVINHSNNSHADKTFTVLIIG